MVARKAIWAGGQEGIPQTECLLTPILCKEKEPTNAPLYKKEKHPVLGQK